MKLHHIRIQFFNFINKGCLYQRNYPVFEALVIRNCLCFSQKDDVIENFLQFLGILFQILTSTLSKRFCESELSRKYFR